MRTAIYLGFLAAGAALLLPAPAARASSHSEAPLIAEDPRADNTDLYFFRSSQDPTRVVILANYIPLEDPSAGPTYYYFSDRVLYEIHVDRDSDGKEDVTFQFRFSTKVQTPGTFLPHLSPISSLTTNGSTIASGNVNPAYNRYQTYTVTMVEHPTRRRRGGAKPRTTVLARDVIVPPNNAGPDSTPDYPALASQAIHTIPGSGIRTFAGQVDDPFFVDLGAIFDLLRVRPFRSLHALQEVHPQMDRANAPDMLAGYNCHTIALEIPIPFLTETASVPASSDPARILGVYASASRQQIQVLRRGGKTKTKPGDFVQVSRLGLPLTNELFIPLADSQGRTRDAWNASDPADDARFAPFFKRPEPALRLAQLFPVLRGLIPNVSADASGFTGDRTDLVGGATPLLNLASDFLRLDVSTPPSASPNRMGVIGGDPQGFPNGRRLGDDVVDIYVRAAAGALFPDTVTVGSFTGTRAQFYESINLGDGVGENDNGRFRFTGVFPFVSPAHPGVRPAHIGYDDPERRPEQ